MIETVGAMVAAKALVSIGIVVALSLIAERVGPRAAGLLTGLEHARTDWLVTVPCDTPDFPPQWKGTAEGGRTALALLRAESALDWTMLHPSALIEPGQRTGEFRRSVDDLIVDANGDSRISVQDFAVAMIDEVEQPAHRRGRFTVGY